MLVGAVFAPQGADDPEFGKRRRAAHHLHQPVVLVPREPVLGDERRRNSGIAGAGKWRQGFFVCAGVDFLLVSAAFGSCKALVLFPFATAAAAGTGAGDELFPVYLRRDERNTASTTLSCSRATMSLIPIFFSSPFR